MSREEKIEQIFNLICELSDQDKWEVISLIIYIAQNREHLPNRRPIADV